MYALVYLSNTEEEESLSTKQHFTICPKCGRLIKINYDCECEAIFFDMLIETD
jgi:hypothetical protein